MLEERIADKVFEAIDAGTIRPLVDWLLTLGCTIVADHGDGTFNLQGLVGMRVGLCLTDPNSLAVQVGFAIAGMYWPQAYPKLQSVVNKRWKERKKKAKA
jgi:hypothetical protein